MFTTPDEVESAFYEALEMADLVRLMQVWANDEEVVCIHPGGLRIVGLSAVQKSWQEVLANGTLYIRPLRPLVIETRMYAMHVLLEQVAERKRTGIQVSNYYATNIYHNGPTGWRMVMHHASPAPAQAGVLDLHDLPDTLH